MDLSSFQRWWRLAGRLAEAVHVAERARLGTVGDRSYSAVNGALGETVGLSRSTGAAAQRLMLQRSKSLDKLLRRNYCQRCGLGGRPRSGSPISGQTVEHALKSGVSIDPALVREFFGRAVTATMKEDRNHV